MKVIHNFAKNHKKLLTYQNAHATILTDKLTKRKNMNHHNTHINRIRLLASASLLLLASVMQVVFSAQSAFAAQITGRSLTLQRDVVNGGTSQGSAPGGGALPNNGVVAHKFDFSMPANASSFQSIVFQYCTTAADVGAQTCVTPTGLVTTSATLTAESGITGATMHNTTNGQPYLSFATPQTIGASTPASYTFGVVTNPSTPNQTFFVRIIAYSAINGTGTVINNGTVAASTVRLIELDGIMPESLVFCTGATITANGNVPDCTTATTGVIHFNQLFSPESTAWATSQMAASTNAGQGYAISVNGPTLTSGANTITAMGTAGQSSFGVSQFGLNLVLNDGTAYANAPNVTGSANIFPVSNNANFRGQPFTTANYGTAGTFKFTTGDTVANSGYQSLGASDGQIYTVSYIANVPGSQPAGTYATTLLYICTPTF